MPDITMCRGEGCSLRETCYRYKSKPTKERQPYSTAPPIEIANGLRTVCEYYDHIDKPSTKPAGEVD